MNFKLVDPASIDAEEWDKFVERSPQGSPYTMFHTMSTLMPGWNAIIAENQGKWEAVFPFPVKKKYGISYCYQLPWTQHSGILLAPTKTKKADQLKRQKTIINGILEIAMKECMAFDFSLSPKFNYLLPFIWKGFELNPRFTYQLDLTKKAKLEDNFSSSTNNKIRKAQKSGYEITPVKNVSKLIQIFKDELGDMIPHLKHEHYIQLENLVRHRQKNDQALALEIRLDGNFAGGLILYLFKDTVYFPISVQPKEHRSSGAMSYLLQEAMQMVKDQGYKTFDFEGSIIEGIEHFFRGFGATPITYMNVSRFPFWLKLIKQK